RGRQSIPLLVGWERKRTAGRRLLPAHEPGGQQALAVAVQQAVVRLQIDLRAEAENDPAAAVQVRLEPSNLGGAKPCHVTEEHAVIRRQVDQAGIGELRLGHYLRPDRET